MQFDEHGHLMPYEIQEISIAEFKYYFVENLGDQIHREQLYDQYLRFVNDIKQAFQSPFFQWVDGSYITTKEFPGDIDVVTFLPYELIVKNLPKIYHFRQNAKTIYQVDAKFSPVCKWNHRNFDDSKQQEAYWFDLFGFSRQDKNGRRSPKGIIKLSF